MKFRNNQAKKVTDSNKHKHKEDMRRQISFAFFFLFGVLNSFSLLVPQANAKFFEQILPCLSAALMVVLNYWYGHNSNGKD